jgi:hypothetical protein
MMAASSRKSFRAIVSSCREQDNRFVTLCHTDYSLKLACFPFTGIVCSDKPKRPVDRHLSGLERYKKEKEKWYSYPLKWVQRPIGLRDVQAPTYSRQLAHDGDEVVSLMC